MRAISWPSRWVWLLAGLLAGPVAAEDMPYTQVPDVGEDASVVRLFFLFSCPHCNHADKPMADWGGSLPGSLVYARTPVVVKSEDSVLGAVAYYTALITQPRSINVYCGTVFKLIHQNGYLATDKSTYFLAARQAGIEQGKFSANWGNSQVKQLVIHAAELTSRYDIKLTPTMVVGGRYAINPEIVSGNMGSFITLANAIVSKRLQEH